MDSLHQNTLRKTYCFEGKGLHTGVHTRMTVGPAPVDTGIRFYRSDLSDEEYVQAVAENVSNTSRSTSLSNGGINVVTVEHILSALCGLGVDNAMISLDNVEVPILDGSARFYTEAIKADGLLVQDAPKRLITVEKTIEIRNGDTGSYIIIEPSDSPSVDVEIDFGSNVLGIQKAHWDAGTDYSSQISVCRTFVFFHEIEFLARQGLVKGGDMDNAIVIVEHPVEDTQIEALCSVLGFPRLSVNQGGYLNNLELRFPNECGRHKLLDILGDLYLSGGWINARITAYKPGHGINTMAAKAVRDAICKR